MVAAPVGEYSALRAGSLWAQVVVGTRGEDGVLHVWTTSLTRSRTTWLDFAIDGVYRCSPPNHSGRLFAKDDLVCWVDGHAVCVGRAYCFVRDARLVHLAVIWRYKQAAGVWCSDGADLRVLPLKTLLAPLAYARLSHNVFHVLPPAGL